ncbi:hypothetical protein TSUD_285500 [Trifolium subterraneum]|uniref:TIR domain-containing protein n=1 Tax=Trifolium subterraneum TaxID=3900 RepID=A0A2Z6NGV6_TRISU|nr:hypothetical protein TSUD_285500 [Trifolium subterraneum]
MSSSSSVFDKLLFIESDFFCDPIPRNELWWQLEPVFDEATTRTKRAPADTRIHDVFLSFRGEDTRASFTSHLYTSLVNTGINVFKDDDSLQRGDNISTSLIRAIEESRIAIIIFSTNYANSRWCLEELVKIMECHITIGQVVLPVFYDVDPSEVRHQTGEFGKTFHSLLNRISKEEDDSLNLKLGIASYSYRSYSEHPEVNWTSALRQAAALAGIVVLNSRNESEAIKDIVENVTRLLDKTDLFIANNPVGVESRVHDMIKLLDQDIQQSYDVLLLGLWGMGGAGKTTIAKAIYNKIGRNFEGRSFLANIREVWKENAAQVNLQEQLLFDICKEMTTKIPSVEYGKIILKDKLCHKRVLIVLDDVNTLDQLNALCGSRTWFGSGSRIIITTRDRHILRGKRVNQVFKMKHMDESESIELFSWHAFKQASPTKGFAEISRNVAEYSGGLPLALEVLGSYLFERGLTEWKSVLDKLKRIPNDQVQKKLKISYDALSDNYEKEIFLDIACFFIGMDRNDVTLILNGCGLFAEIGISILVERSLVTVDDKNRLGMHDLLRDMGREIIREKSPEDLEERCRLWFNEDVLHVLSEQTGTKAIKGLALKLPTANAKCFSSKAFKKMKRLRLLQLAGKMEKLKILNLSHSHYLTRSPDFSNMPNLEKLILKDCPMLSEISPSIGDLSKILLIDLEDCVSLRSLPRNTYKLKSLKTLILSGCLRIDKLEEDLEQMESLTTLLANDTAITRVPFSVVRSKSIGYISLCGYEGFSSDVFPSIILSWMSPTCNIPSPFQTSNIMSSLVPLDVPHSSSYELSSISKYLPSLRSLWIECSSELQLSQDAAIILDALFATNIQMEPTAITAQASNMTTCTSQVSKHSSKSLLIQIGMNGQVTNILKEIILQNIDVSGTGGCFLPGDSYPNWLTFNSEGSFVTFQVPRVEGRNLKTIMCIVYTSTPDNVTSSGLKNMLVKNYTKATIQLYKSETLVSFEDEEGQRVVSSIEPGDKVEVVVVFENNFIVKKTVVYLVYDEPIGKNMELYDVPDLNAVACSDDENEHSAKRFSSENKPTDDLNQNRKKKNRVE